MRGSNGRAQSWSAWRSSSAAVTVKNALAPVTMLTSKATSSPSARHALVGRRGLERRDLTRREQVLRPRPAGRDAVRPVDPPPPAGCSTSRSRKVPRRPALAPAAEHEHLLQHARKRARREQVEPQRLALAHEPVAHDRRRDPGQALARDDERERPAGPQPRQRAEQDADPEVADAARRSPIRSPRSAAATRSAADANW